jgi:hypothetical protein
VTRKLSLALPRSWLRCGSSAGSTAGPAAAATRVRGARTGACGPARRNVAASGTGAPGARPRGLARAGAAAFGRAQGRHASDPAPARRSAAERWGISSDTTSGSTGPTVAWDERAASAVGDWHSGNTNNAFGRDHATRRQRQARNAATTNAGCKALYTNNAFGRDHAGHAIAWKQARNAGTASARRKTGDTIIATGADQARHGVAIAASRRRCQARKSGDTASRRKAACAGSRCRKPGTTSGGA